jgi:hypothetical protein
MKFYKLKFSCLPNETHYSFFEKVNREIIAAGEEVKKSVQSLIPVFDKWFAVEKDNLNSGRKSNLTAEIAKADRELDEIMRGFAAQVSAAQRNFSTDIAEAALRLHNMLNEYGGGNVAQKPYQQEIGAVFGILANLNGDRSADLTATGLDAWKPQIANTHAALLALLEQRDSEMLDKPGINFRETRREIEKVWHQITEKVDAGETIGLSEDFQKFIDRLNPEIERLNNTYHRAKHNIALCEPAPIEQQPYTGRPSTPEPKVLYVTAHDGTIQLELGKDFNLTYKNNVEVGNAECTIHGKGAYRGSRTVTFIISR